MNATVDEIAPDLFSDYVLRRESEFPIFLFLG